MINQHKVIFFQTPVYIRQLCVFSPPQYKSKNALKRYFCLNAFLLLKRDRPFNEKPVTSEDLLNGMCRI